MKVLWILILLAVVSPSYQKVYSCNPTATCGCSSKPASMARIVGGEDARTASWGWVVSLSMADVLMCGGSILSSEWIITAAHCVYNYSASQVTIYAGSNILWFEKQTRTVSQIIIHSDYNDDTYDNDIALLRITSPLNMSDPAVRSICLPSINSTILDVDEWPVANTTVVTVGWGNLVESGESSDKLQQVTLQTIDYRSSTCDPSIDHQVQLCAGVPDGTKDSCQGDSGGPLMMFTPSRQWVLVGIVSNGDGCANVSSAGRYTRVAAFQSWIRSYTNASYWILSDSTFSTIPSVVNATSILTNASTATMLSNSTTRSKSIKSLVSIYSSTNTISIARYHLYLGILLILIFPSFSNL